jgi:hypothetical protein
VKVVVEGLVGVVVVVVVVVVVMMRMMTMTMRMRMRTTTMVLVVVGESRSSAESWQNRWMNETYNLTRRSYVEYPENSPVITLDLSGDW